jgi:hypothetical protein
MVFLVAAVIAGASWVQPAEAQSSASSSRTVSSLEPRSDVLVAVGSLQAAGVILFEAIARNRRRSRGASDARRPRT